MSDSNLIKKSKEQKIDALSNAMAFKIAQQHHDPLFKKYSKLRKKYVKLKRLIAGKYSIQGMAAARTALDKISDK